MHLPDGQGHIGGNGAPPKSRRDDQIRGELSGVSIRSVISLALSPHETVDERLIEVPYNLIRFLMAQAAAQAGVHPQQLSFKHTVQLWTEWVVQGLAGRAAERTTVFFHAIAQQQVGDRPGRIEPRARKRRPKPYQWLKVPRKRARRQVRLYGYLRNPST